MISAISLRAEDFVEHHVSFPMQLYCISLTPQLTVPLVYLFHAPEIMSQVDKTDAGKGVWKRKRKRNGCVLREKVTMCVIIEMD